MLENGDLVGALRSIAITGRSKNVSKIAERLVPYVGNTQVKLVSGGLRNPQGQVAAGVFDPATNTISASPAEQKSSGRHHEGSAAGARRVRSQTGVRIGSLHLD